MVKQRNVIIKMSKSYVRYLYYTLNIKECIYFKKPILLDKKLDNFHLKLEDNKLKCRMIKIYSKTEDARKDVEDYLKSWQIYAELKTGNTGEIEFIYDGVEIIDYKSNEFGKEPHYAAQNVGSSEITGELMIIVERDSYPEPLEYFQRNHKVDILWNRYDDYKKGKEKLPSMAYFCLTFLENDAGNRGNIAKKYKISKNVLKKFASLSSTKGRLDTDARKAKYNQGPLTEEEIKWLDEVIRKIIIRVGEHENNLNLELIDMSSLPEIE